MLNRVAFIAVLVLSVLGCGRSDLPNALAGATAVEAPAPKGVTGTVKFFVLEKPWKTVGAELRKELTEGGAGWESFEAPAPDAMIGIHRKLPNGGSEGWIVTPGKMGNDTKTVSGTDSNWCTVSHMVSGS